MLKEIEVRRVQHSEEARFQQLMQAHHYLGALPKIGETLWYVAHWGAQSFVPAASGSPLRPWSFQAHAHRCANAGLACFL